MVLLHFYRLLTFRPLIHAFLFFLLAGTALCATDQPLPFLEVDHRYKIALTGINTMITVLIVQNPKVGSWYSVMASYTGEAPHKQWINFANVSVVEPLGTTGNADQQD